MDGEDYEDEVYGYYDDGGYKGRLLVRVVVGVGRVFGLMARVYR